MTKYLQESRMREICTSGSTRGSNGAGDSRPLLSTLLVVLGRYTPNAYCYRKSLARWWLGG